MTILGRGWRGKGEKEKHERWAEKGKRSRNTTGSGEKRFRGLLQSRTSQLAIGEESHAFRKK